MNIIYSEAFIRDLKKLKRCKIYSTIKHLAFDILPTLNSINDIQNMKKLSGYKDKARIKINDFRVAFVIINEDEIVLSRVLHRKDIYRYFP